MAFTVEDFQDLLRLLEQRPEWRSELRRHVLSDEILELPALVRELAQRVDELAQAQKRTEERIDALAGQMAVLADRAGGMADRMGSIEGELLERRFERFATAYFSPLARRLRVVDRSALADALDDAVDAGHITDMDRDAVLRADIVLSGQTRDERTDAYFVVEVSKGVGLEDVRRASERAAILSRLGKPAVPVVAGEWVTEDARLAAHTMDVRQIAAGRRGPASGQR